MRVSLLAACVLALVAAAFAAPYWSLSDSYEPSCANWENVKAAYDEVIAADPVKDRVRNNFKITSVRL